jgi:hypothetical protein
MPEEARHFEGNAALKIDSPNVKLRFEIKVWHTIRIISDWNQLAEQRMFMNFDGKCFESFEIDRHWVILSTFHDCEAEICKSNNFANPDSFDVVPFAAIQILSLPDWDHCPAIPGNPSGNTKSLIHMRSS